METALFLEPSHLQVILLIGEIMIDLAADGVFDKSNLFTGNVHIMEGTNYSAASVSANNLSAFAYCRSGTVTPWNPNGTVRNWEISGN